MAHWLMSEGSPGVIVLQWDFLNDWHSSLKKKKRKKQALPRAPERAEDGKGRSWKWGLWLAGMWLSHNYVFEGRQSLDTVE